MIDYHANMRYDEKLCNFELNRENDIVQSAFRNYSGMMMKRD